jgi:hypothetical protein
MTIKSARATLGPTTHGKREMAKLFYEKGKHFIGAAILLRNRGGDEYVVLHLLCQGTEIILKALLLLRDFDKFYPLTKKYGHKLKPLVSDALNEFKLRQLRPAVSEELEKLDELYQGHQLRYGLLINVFINPASIPSRLVLGRVGAAMRLANRELAAG